ncbi:5-methylcytosine-specific restriction endonuclease McrBC, regulatory subunit McrC [Pseudomonas seleniipraecipitans]|uniref:5-methylcytosine-specific restriction endonuclease McrBC, regulatory subunit McrC n=1 Tax=Phytopseudomonas seleniipraecipitans TaxID=640205 RepID=A0A1G7T4J7_9GAMM|nr:5-methylcytosine-specific restriction endonuclease McrBC, regulatory subunit McrC [Pseudomonas seleniipraecipitans]
MGCRHFSTLCERTSQWKLSSETDKLLKITTKEGSPIDIPEGHDRLAIYENLQRAAEKLGINAFRWKQKKLYAAEVVGYIQAQGIQLNILPKLDTLEENRDEDFLFNLLASSGYIKNPKFAAAQTKKTALEPLEIIISELAGEIEAALRGGIPRRYEETREDSQSIRGKIDFPRLSTRPPGNTLIPILHSPLSAGNKLSQAVKFITGALHHRTTSSINRQRLGAILELLSNIKNREFSSRELHLIKISRHETQWERTISIGQMLSTGHSPDPTFSGESSAFSLLFKLEHLFERSMRKIISESIKDSGLKVLNNNLPLYLLNDAQSKKGIVQLRPDYVLHKNENYIAIADAKWKRLDRTKRAYGVDRDDLYQINAYLGRFKVEKGIVFVPRLPWMQAGWSVMYEIPESPAKIYLVGVDLECLLSRNEITRKEAYTSLSCTLKNILN